MNKNLYILFFVLGIFFTCSCSKDSAIPTLNNTGSGTGNNPPISYLDKWVGEYNGTSRHWHSVFSSYNEVFKKVMVDVQKSSLDSSLNFIITYDDTIVDTKTDLKISSLGVYDTSWGGGSSFGYLQIKFVSDSLKYDYFSKCGIPCSFGINFKIPKK